MYVRKVIRLATSMSCFPRVEIWEDIPLYTQIFSYAGFEEWRLE